MTQTTAAARARIRRRPRAASRGAHLTMWFLRLVTVAGLVVDAYVHSDLAALYDPVRGSSGITEGNLFRAAAGAACAAALILLLSAGRTAWVIAFLVAASAVGAVLLYQYVDVGAIGPLPDMNDTTWTTEKAICAIGEGVATLGALIGMVLAFRAAHRARRTR